MAENLARIVTKENILKAINKIDTEALKLHSSTKFDILHEGKRYPPKELVRQAAKLQGIENWYDYRLSGGESTNAPLRKMGFEVIAKEIPDETYVKLSGDVWKLGCNWGESAPSFYDLLKNESVVICTDDKMYKPGDIVLLASGHTIKALAKVMETPWASTEDENLKNSFDKYEIDYDPWVKISDAFWYELSETEQFDYPIALGRHRVHEPYKTKALELWRKHFDSSGTKPFASTEIDKKVANLILYGPPGTGKTYNTASKALEILTGRSYSGVDRELVLEEYSSYFEKKQIQFVTFHQSMTYEDFIEGLKPSFDNNTNQMKYPVLDGIFKVICTQAIKSMYYANTSVQEQESDLEQLFKQFIQHLKTSYSEEEFPFTTKHKTEMRFDSSELENDRIVVYYRWNNASKKELPGKTPFLIKPDVLIKMYNAGIKDNETNIKEKMKDIISYHYFQYYAVYRTFFKFIKDSVKDNVVEERGDIGDVEEFSKYLEQLQIIKKQKKELVPGKPYVLIIDEINRGNVSQIFGELITLLEKDKRFGNKECLTVKLPYSKKDFVVPNNVFIIGTMNTADRSVEALDTALRRRFSFEFVPPMPHLLNGKVIGGINLTELLEKLNSRVAYLLDDDHRIGHSYFFNVGSPGQLAQVFSKNIIPLLKEYFYNDFGKIRMILGDGFVTKRNNADSKQKFAVKDESFLMDRAVYSIVEPNEDTIIEALTKTLADA